MPSSARHRRRASSLLACGVPLVAAVFAASLHGQAAPEPSEAVIRRHIEALADDSMRGRGTPSRELRQAARFTAAAFQRAGLGPAPGWKGLIQWFPFVRRALRPDDVELTIRHGDRRSDLVYGTDFFIMVGAVDSLIGRVVPLGGIADTARIQSGLARGAVGLVTLERAQLGSWIGPVHTAMRIAREGGLQAIVVLADAPEADSTFAAAVALTRIMDHGADGVPVVGIRREALGRLLGGESAVADLLRGRQGNANLELSLRTPFDLYQSDAPNVVAYLPGADPRRRDEFVVVSAHLDHVGIGTPNAAGDSVFNGADDNASGVAAVLAMAEVLARRPPARSILFLLPGAEEQGIRGSPWFVNHSPVPMARVVANVNLDGVARQWQRDTLSVVGQGYSTLGQLVQSVNAASGDLRLVVVEDQWNRGYYTRSDQIAFARAGVPAIFFSSSGPHPDYHGLGDEPHTVDYPWLTRLTSLALRTVEAIANADARPAWLPSSPYQRP